MNKKGFTIVELGMSFCIVAAISIVLFQLLMSIKELYLAGNIKTSLLNKQAIMTKRIYSDLSDYDVSSISSCGISCLEFTYLNKIDSTEAKKSKLLIDPYNSIITYDEYSIYLEKGTTFGQITVEYDKKMNDEIIANYDRILKINIPVTNKLVEGEFGLNIIFQYNEDKVSVNNQINIENAILTLDNIDIPIKELYENDQKQGTYAKIFYHNIDNGNQLFETKEQFLKSNTEYKYSALFALNQFEGKYNSNKDAYEFLLYYPSLEDNKYNHWIQTNNFTKEEITGYNEININWNQNWNGLSYIDNDCAFVSGSTNSNICSFSLGAKQATNNALIVEKDGNQYNSQDVELWVRIDDYIGKYALSQVIS